MAEPKYFELHAHTTLNISGFMKPELEPVEPPKGGLFIASSNNEGGFDVSFKKIAKPADKNKKQAADHLCSSYPA